MQFNDVILIILCLSWLFAFALVVRQGRQEERERIERHNRWRTMWLEKNNRNGH